MKSPTVTSIDSFSIKAEIKKCPIDVQQYISALERSLERQKDVTNEAIKKIKELSSKAPEKEEEKWISVEDRLPEIGERVSVYCHSQGVQLCYLDVRLKWSMAYDMSRAYLNITHWQPLPEPPKN